MAGKVVLSASPARTFGFSAFYFRFSFYDVFFQMLTVERFSVAFASIPQCCFQ